MTTFQNQRDCPSQLNAPGVVLSSQDRPLPRISSVAVFCGASRGHNDKYIDIARVLGRWIVDRKLRLVYGAGRDGVMGSLSRAVLSRGGQVTGVIPRFLLDSDHGDNESPINLIVVNTLEERKSTMFQLSDAFVVLPGGIGTLDETIAVLASKALRLHRKPIFLLNVDGYWNPLQTLISSFVSSKFVEGSLPALYNIISDPTDILLYARVEPSSHESPQPFK